MVNMAASPCDAKLHDHYIGPAFTLYTHLWRLQTKSHFRILSYGTAPRGVLHFLLRGTSARSQILTNDEAKVKGPQSVSDSTQLYEVIRLVDERHQEGTPNIPEAR